MVINHTIVTIETMSTLVIWPIAKASHIKIKENSLICATVNQTIIPFFLLYHIHPINTITINGFPTRTNREKTIIGTIYTDTSENCSCDHKNTKKRTIKKSLSGFILLLISNLYGSVAKVNQANNAPISNENPTASSPAANNKHRPIENKRRNSCDLATYHIMRGRKYFVSAKTTSQTTAIFPSNILENIHRLIAAPSTGNEANIISMTIAMIS